MPQYEKRRIETAAKENGFTRDAFEKVLRLTDILRFLNSENTAKRYLALKGGTAINLTMFPLPRLSVDLDFDFAENLPREQMQRQREDIVSMLSKHMSAEGYSLSPKTKRAHSLDSFVYSYAGLGGGGDNMKIEINYSLRSHVLPLRDSLVRIPAIGDSFSLRTLSPVEIYAGKTVAFLDRGAARDLYDLNNMVEGNLFSSDECSILRKCVVFYAAIAGKKPITDNWTIRFPSVTPGKVKTDLNPMLRIAEYFEAGTATERVKGFLGELMVLSGSELRFGERFKRGLYEPEFLFDDDTIVNRVKDHPMALWRINHIREDRVR
jgi:predicted nucleotidyltransferase component of viral defense system